MLDQSSAATPPGTGGAASPSDTGSDLFAKMFPGNRRASSDPKHVPQPVPLARPEAPRGDAPRSTARVAGGRAVVAPTVPDSLAASGMSLMQMCDLVMKQLYLQGALLGAEIARNARVPFRVIEESLVFLKDQKLVEVMSGDVIGRVSYRFNLTEKGRHRARESFEQCRYVGPAPVTLDDYVRQSQNQAVTGTVCDPRSLEDAFHGMIVRPGLLDELGPAVCSGRSIFVYGPPGNGKTMIAKGLGRFLNAFGGDIYVPYAVQSDNSIFTVFDPTIHNAVDITSDVANQDIYSPTTSSLEGAVDTRWVRIRRPVVITGGELSLEMLDLRYNATANFYQAPLHIKANGGVFLIDDFGRQLVSPKDLLNRWILPLEEKTDYLTLATGKKLSVPFEQLIIFSTNLDPKDLVDEAFLRRIRHKIEVGTPDRGLFTDIFRLQCAARGLDFKDSAVDYLFRTFYDRGRLPRSSDPRDLLEIAQSACRFRNQAVVLTDELMADATRRFFGRL